MSFLGIYIILKLSFGVSTRGFLDFLLGGIGDGCQGALPQKSRPTALTPLATHLFGERNTVVNAFRGNFDLEAEAQA